MPYKHKRKTPDSAQVIGAIIFIALFIGLILLGIYVESDGNFGSSFFEDVGRVMEGTY
ncbi:MAG: hypothetical protein OQK98_08665 [Gammaproteobacteria bacterium]|nr:hypothetical protein [Gammaproteobacteria bacterium]